MKAKTNTLTKELEALNKQSQTIEKKKEALEKKIEAEKNKNKPKSIIDRIKTMADVIRIGKPSKEALAIINYSGKDPLVLFARDFTTLALISKVYNEGWEPKMDGSEDRYYAWFYLSSGFSFCTSGCDIDDAYTASASRLCLKRGDLALDGAQKFQKQYERAIVSGFLTQIK